jgi:cytochrome c-type biogenesis protein
MVTATVFAENVTYPAALMAGLLSFFSPCILPLIPAYFTFITGYSLEELTGGLDSGIRKKVFQSTLFYVLGFSLVFVLMGASASFLGNLVTTYKEGVRIVGGIIVIIFGLHLTGAFRIPILDYEKRIHLNKKPLHFLGTFIVGMGFGAGWSPCIGPLLGAILIIAANQETVWHGITLLGIYSIGLAIPFMVISMFIHVMISIVKKASGIMRYLNAAAGILLILVGCLLIINKFYIFT